MMLPVGEISHSEMERLLFDDQQDTQCSLAGIPPVAAVFGLTNQGIQEALRSHICGDFQRAGS
ncbi:hypothetical protein O6A27_06195 [Escherichia coli]|nr:hypothetical protein [Escherichia coli]